MSNVLVLNCGSSSVKFALINPLKNQTAFSGLAENISQKNCKVSFKANKKIEIAIENGKYEDVFSQIKAYMQDNGYLSTVSAVGHRVVHGGQYFDSSVLITENVIEKIKKCITLAPLHNPANVDGIEYCERIFPKLPQVAVFDTAFHQTIEKYVAEYAIPRELTDKYHIRKYGFHGTSHNYVSKQAAKLLNKERGNFIVAHLGNGCSLSAIVDGKSVDTSMGFTPLDGLIMGTRSGSIDAGIFSFLAKNLGWNVEKISSVLNKESGLLGICGHNDMREIRELAAKGHTDASLAIKMFSQRVAKFVASYMIYFDTLDALVFTGGIGENANTIRKNIVDKLSNIGFEIDSAKNDAKDQIYINSDRSHKIMVVPTNEELMIAKDTLQLV
ncbi:acetate/propionate family kinase [Francisella frigiditurris]|uniref:Acetate kinase n=1 Tax=Francisella frigiditurris TaxID=1542390 RepID=A0A1J0KTC1_9GAMM|nr:acetate kinase [Francisella frigiditurris]APC96946.1 acetate kinase [Francisella frigiditurris]